MVCCTVIMYAYFTHIEQLTTYPEPLYYLKDISDWQALAIAAHILPGNPTGPIEIIYIAHKGDAY